MGAAGGDEGELMNGCIGQSRQQVGLTLIVVRPFAYRTAHIIVMTRTSSPKARAARADTNSKSAELPCCSPSTAHPEDIRTTGQQ